MWPECDAPIDRSKKSKTAVSCKNCELCQRLVDRDTPRADALVERECDADRVLVPDRRPDRHADLERQAAPRLDTSAVRVVAAVVERAEKLPDEPTMGTVHLDAVRSAGLHQPRGLGRSPPRADGSPRSSAARAFLRPARERATET